MTNTERERVNDQLRMMRKVIDINVKSMASIGVPPTKLPDFVFRTASDLED